MNYKYFSSFPEIFIIHSKSLVVKRFTHCFHMQTHSIYQLNMLGLPPITNINEFSSHTHISHYTLFQLSKNAEHHYKRYIIKKKSGRDREINQPSKPLKGLQSWILVNILNKLKVSSSCKGFEKKSSTIDNAKPHIGASALLTIDLEDFFSTITRNHVFNVFRSIGYNLLISNMLSNICTINNYLPQGGPCSPKLANLVAWKLDKRVQGYVGRRGIIYTRYADDLSFSGVLAQDLIQILPRMTDIIKDEGFNINSTKTRIAGPTKAKVITGLTLYDDNVGMGKKNARILRSKIHKLTLNFYQNDLILLNHVMGWLSYMYSIDKKRYVVMEKYVANLKKLHPDKLINQIAIKKTTHQHIQ